MTDPEARGGSYGSEPAGGSFLIIRILEKENCWKTLQKINQQSLTAPEGRPATLQSSKDKDFHSLAGQSLVPASIIQSTPYLGSCCSVHQKGVSSPTQAPSHAQCLRQTSAFPKDFPSQLRLSTCFSPLKAPHHLLFVPHASQIYSTRDYNASVMKVS